ncbi:CLL_collapsed_G0018310.mRNA.1.CDS.1 [Saccharomyces cerevisiae]|uniref:Probable metalloreductase AIM14 n=1 Tax=Saccharomyces cerevisiae (strain Kyokai no. 7 / NBRC 101557) TaxID=721032 RepID=G2WDU5_YEASK|nr:Aim14p [Saccharomyces cerevisiae YJM450]CAI4457460.1 CLN_G0018870.mRNA.1.CDS.1 [Saccharomyces cerevisiae]GAA23238.1 K7_Ygl160wp [Saccharomyces cerevisiae Kyokai no. 7]CAI4460260.1 ADQ_G0018760.mRNA.1.CDS.1 [Saccharomyces cerevisiae]CAI4917660.1 CRE_HP_G0014900.mRNA.1.CDS.1 [Saccharomyces cerevisiae]
MKESPLITLVKRHSETHFANIKYGYYVLIISLVYLIGLALLRAFGRRTPSRSSSAFKNKIIYRLYDIDPAIHLGILFFAVLIPFYYHYSLTTQSTVYLKRLGRLSYALIPLNLFLTLRPNWFLRKNCTYTDFIPFHKWFSRIITVIGLLHGIFFIIKWAMDDNVSLKQKLILKTFNFVGFIISILVLFLLICSIGPMRRYNYRLFYIVHNLVNVAFILLTPIHSRPGVKFPFLLLNCTLLFIHIINRIVFAKSLMILNKNANYSKTNLVHVRLPRAILPDYFEPGSHIRISPYRRINPLYWLLPSHPYTIASLAEDNSIDLIIKETSTAEPGSQIESLRSNPKSFHLDQEKTYTLINSYPPSVPEECYSQGTNIAIICGGSGISFALPLFRHFFNKENVKYLKMIWLIKNYSEYELVLDYLKTNGLTFEKKLSNNKRISVFISGEYTAETRLDEITTNIDDENSEYEMGSFNNEDEDFSISNFNSENADSNDNTPETSHSPTKENGSLIEVKSKHSFTLSNELKSFNNESAQVNQNETWLFSCGPPSLLQLSKKYCNDERINFVCETYGL